MLLIGIVKATLFFVFLKILTLLRFLLISHQESKNLLLISPLPSYFRDNITSIRYTTSLFLNWSMLTVN